MFVLFFVFCLLLSFLLLLLIIVILLVIILVFLLALRLVILLVLLLVLLLLLPHILIWQFLIHFSGKDQAGNHCHQKNCFWLVFGVFLACRISFELNCLVLVGVTFVDSNR